MTDSDKVIEAFKTAGKPLKNAEIVKISGLDKNKVIKVIKKLKDEGKIHSPKRCYYDLIQ